MTVSLQLMLHITGTAQKTSMSFAHPVQTTELWLGPTRSTHYRLPVEKIKGGKGVDDRPFYPAQGKRAAMTNLYY